MPNQFSEDSDSVDPTDEQLESEVWMDIDAWLERLRKSDRSLYNLMALEVWSIAKTMDALIPGFWSRFMANRQVALKQFVEHRKKHPSTSNNGSEPDSPEAPEPPEPPPPDEATHP